MTDKVHRLIELWQNCPLDNAPFILPEDKTEIQKRTVLYRSFEDYATIDIQIMFRRRGDPCGRPGQAQGLPLPRMFF